MFKKSILAIVLATAAIAVFAPAANAGSDMQRNHPVETAERPVQTQTANRRKGRNEVVVTRASTSTGITTASGNAAPDRAATSRRLNCNVGVRKLQSLGYESITPVDCKGKTYNYSAMVGASLFRASMSAYTGDINVTFIGLAR